MLATGRRWAAVDDYDLIGFCNTDMNEEGAARLDGHHVHTSRKTGFTEAHAKQLTHILTGAV